ncbi:MAG: NAD(P)/FAD-dependent oxidoreductase [Sandaracinaceae bacterium]|nr:NAD(P)/FAD-dependent oxidoreductase [Sandaracinaceae bacterium]
MGKKAVIIGTGAGGLTAAARLAQHGYEVVALERGKQIGGYLNPFARKHFHFDPGLHYVGSCAPGEMIHRVLRSVGIDAQEMFCAMDRDGFDVIRFPGFEVRVCAGLDAYEARLRDLFPEDRKDLARFFGILRLAADLSRGRRPALGKLKALADVPLVFGTFGRLLERVVRNPRLRAVLAGQIGDAGLPPSRAPALLGLGVILHFAEGGYFPRGGTGRLRDALVEAATSNGAVFHRRAEVTKIHVTNGAVRAVETDEGRTFEADVVVAACDPTLTYGTLIDPEHVPQKILRKARRTKPSVASVCVFLGMKRDLRAHGLGAFNVWDYPTWDLDRVYGDIMDGKVPEDWPVFLSPNSLKDDSGSMAPEGCSTLEVVTLAPHGPFAKWEGMKSFKRGDEYLEVKERYADSVLASVERRWPGLVGDVVVRDVATPVTNSHYVNAPAGSIYGPAATSDQFAFNAFRAKSPIKGLALAGAGTLGPGVGSCLASGLAAAKALRQSEERSFFAFPRRRPQLQPGT